MVGGQKERKWVQKDLITYVDKPTRYVGLGWARTGLPEGKQDRHRVRGKNRYVIKVMNSHREGGQVLLSARTKGCPKPFNWSIINLLYLF